MMNAVKSTAALGLITLVMAALVSLVYEVTAEPIAALQLQHETETIARLLPGTVETSVSEPDEEGIIQRLIRGYGEDGEQVGYVVAVAPVGYAGPIEMMVGFGIERNLRDVVITRQSETPGLGNAILAPEFLAQFAGRDTPMRVTRVPTGEHDIVALASATISTEAVVRGVNVALEYVQSLE